ncbi:hypothetical protein VCR26J2_370631 [Vibrio coralliirubri]|nr:hypothetical protein VCR26J2_370631 [Vibrio coralliirubri]
MRTCLASLKRQTKPKLKGFNSYSFQGYDFQGQSFQGQKLQRFTSKGANY